MGSELFFTAARSQEIEDGTIVSGLVNVSGHLILYRHDGGTVDAGYIKGDPGTPAPPVSAATTTASGIVELATVTEVTVGTDNVRAVTPAGLAGLTSTQIRRGLIEIATDTEVTTGTDVDRAVTPAGLAALTANDTRKGLVELATFAETVTGTDNTRAVTPDDLAKFMNYYAPTRYDFSGVSQLEIPAVNFDEYELEWVLTDTTTGQLILQVGTTGVPITTNTYDSNNMYAGSTTPATDLQEAVSSIRVTPASSGTRRNFIGQVTIFDLNVAAQTKFLGVTGINNATADTATATVTGKHRNATIYTSLFLSITGGTMTGYAILKKTKYKV